MNVSQEQITDMLMSMHKQSEYFAHSVQYNPRDDTSFASWGSMLMRLSMVCEQQDEKKKYLKEGIEKLERALELNQDSRTHEGELAVFELGNALYFEFFLEKDDKKAEVSLKAAKLKFEEAARKEPNNKSFEEMLKQLGSAHEQRKAAHDHLARLEGKSEEEKKSEIRSMQTQMLLSVVDGHRKAVEADPNGSMAHSELAKSLFELAMLQTREEAQATLQEALVVCEKSFICLSGEKSVGMERSVSGFVWVRGVLQQAFAMVTRDADEAANLKSKAAADFEKVLSTERDSTQRDALKKEKELLDDTMKAWLENITAHEAKTGAKSSGKAPQSSAVPQAVPTKSAGGGKEASQGNDLLVLVGGVLLVVAGVWWFTRSKK